MFKFKRVWKQVLIAAVRLQIIFGFDYKISNIDLDFSIYIPSRWTGRI